MGWKEWRWYWCHPKLDDSLCDYLLQCGDKFLNEITTKKKKEDHESLSSLYVSVFEEADITKRISSMQGAIKVYRDDIMKNN